jgi:hypothetical protein
MDAAIMTVFKDADNAVITAPSGAVTTAAVILESEKAQELFDAAGSEKVYQRKAMFRVAQVGTLEKNSTVVTDGYTYQLEEIAERDYSMVTVDLVRRIDTAKYETDRMRRTR